MSVGNGPEPNSLLCSLDECVNNKLCETISLSFLLAQEIDPKRALHRPPCCRRMNYYKGMIVRRLSWMFRMSSVETTLSLIIFIRLHQGRRPFPYLHDRLRMQSGIRPRIGRVGVAPYVPGRVSVPS